MAEMFAPYDTLPAPLRSALDELKQLIEEVDGKTLAIPDDQGCFIDNGVVVAGDVIPHFNTVVNDLARLRAENERRLALLQSLLTDPPATLDEPDTDAEVIVKMRKMIRAALTNG